MGRKIGVVSAKGGVGKTLITINLACAMMERAQSVIALDADVKLSGLSLQLGMYYFPVTLTDVLEGKRSILESMYIHSSGLRIIPASLDIDNSIAFAQFQQVLDSPALEGHTLLVDCPPGLEKNALDVLRALPEAIVVTTPEIPAVADVMKTISFARKTRTQLLGVVVNRYRKNKDQITPEEIAHACELPVLGVIPDDEAMRQSVFHRFPAVVAHPYARSSLEFKRIAGSLLGLPYTQPRYPSVRRMLWKNKRS